MQEKFCKDCRHSSQEDLIYYPSFWYCNSPKNGRNLVTGEYEKYLCEDARDFLGCKKEANWFEPKDQST